MYVLWNLAQRKNQGFKFQAVTFEKKEIILKGLQFYLLVLEIYTLQSSSQIETYRVDLELVSLKQEFRFVTIASLIKIKADISYRFSTLISNWNIGKTKPHVFCTTSIILKSEVYYFNYQNDSFYARYVLVTT